jgi:hypothetical protein
MGWFRKLIRREPSYEQWLEKNPEKRSHHMEAPTDAESDAAGMRKRMEDEMDSQRAQRK